MHPFLVVVSQIFLECAIDGCNIIRKMVEAFLLDRPVESFDMGIVIRLPDPRVAVFLFHLLPNLDKFRTQDWGDIINSLAYLGLPQLATAHQ